MPPLPDDETIGFHAEQAIENSLKSWVSALGLLYAKDHNLDSLIGTLQAASDETELQTSAAEALAWLTDYAVAYGSGDAIMPLEDPMGLVRATLNLVDRVTQETSRLMAYDMTIDSAIALAYNSLQFLRDSGGQRSNPE